MTQQQVIDYIKKHGSMTTKDARDNYNANNLASIIQNINNRGEYKIKQELKGRVTFNPNKADKTITHYIFEESANAEQVLKTEAI